MLTVLDTPLITAKLAVMRDKHTSCEIFAQRLNEIASLMVYEVTKNLKTRSIEIETPMGLCQTAEIAGDIVLVPILRAGMGLTEGFKHLIPSAKVGVVGLYRNEETLMPVEYLVKLPKNLADSTVIVLDPMLATGGSSAATIDILKQNGAKDIRLVCLVGVPEGVKKIEETHPDVDIYLAAMDDHLNEIGYIVPGLGDAGDRIFGTI